MLVVGLGLCMPVAGAVVDSHKPVTYHFAVTNTTDKPQMIESVRTSCACLKVNMGGSYYQAIVFGKPRDTNRATPDTNIHKFWLFVNNSPTIPCSVARGLAAASQFAQCAHPT